MDGGRAPRRTAETRNAFLAELSKHRELSRLWGELLELEGMAIDARRARREAEIKLLAQIRNNPADVRFSDTLKVARHHFGEPRINGFHHMFTVPGRRPINLQERGDKAKRYQIEQLIEAIDADVPRRD